MSKKLPILILITLCLPTSSTFSASSGDLIKITCTQNNQSICRAVYYLAEDGKRCAFPNQKVYDTWYDDFSEVQEVTQAQMAAYPYKGKYYYKENRIKL